MSVKGELQVTRTYSFSTEADIAGCRYFVIPPRRPELVERNFDFSKGRRQAYKGGDKGDGQRRKGGLGY